MKSTGDGSRLQTKTYSMEGQAGNNEEEWGTLDGVRPGEGVEPGRDTGGGARERGIIYFGSPLGI